MKKARNILWVLFPISLIIQLILVYFRVPMSLFTANLIIAIIFSIPVTAMLLQTIYNKDKNLSKNYYIIKLTAVALLYAMIIYMFINAILLNG